MTADRDVEHVLRHWLVDGVDEMPDRVYLSILDRVDRQPQQRAWRVSWRDSHVNAYLKPLLAVAAIAVIAVAGFAVLQPRSDSNVGGAPSPIPSPTAVASEPPSAVPSSSAVFPSWFPQDSDGAGILPAGSHTTQQFLAGSTFTVPDGWVNDGDYTPAYWLFPDTPANATEYAASKGTAEDITLTNRIERNLVAICDAAGLFQGTTSSEIIDWVVANEALSTTEPVEVTIGGLNGLRVDLRLSPDWTGSCALTENDPPDRDYADFRGRFVVLDTPDRGSIGIWIAAHSSADFEAFLADAMPIVESFEFNLTP